MFYKGANKQSDPLVLSGDEEDDGLIVESPGRIKDDKLLSEDEPLISDKKSTPT